MASARPWLHAHRGASVDAPENTLAAFRLALEQGADGIELDVELSADGVPVVIHDATLERTTDRTGAIASLDARAIVEADTFAAWSRRSGTHPSRLVGPAAVGPRETRVPTLEEVGAWLPDGAGFVLDIKDAAAVPAIVAIVAVRLSASSTVRLISFLPAAIQRARELASHLETGLLLDLGESLADGIARASADRHTSVVPDAEDLGDQPWLGVQAAAAAGLSLGCYVVNDAARAAALRDAGVAFVMTDVPLVIRALSRAVD